MPGVLVDGMDVMKVLPRCILPEHLMHQDLSAGHGRHRYATTVQSLECPLPDQQQLP